MFRRSPDDIGSMSSPAIGRHGLVVAQTEFRRLGPQSPFGYAGNVTFGYRRQGEDGAFKLLASDGGGLELPIDLIDNLLPESSEATTTWYRHEPYGVRVVQHVIASRGRRIDPYGFVSAMWYTACPVDGTRPLGDIELLGAMRFGTPDTNAAILTMALRAIALHWVGRAVYWYEMGRSI